MNWKESIAILEGVKKELEYNLKIVKNTTLTKHIKSEWKQQIEALDVAIEEIQITIDSQ